MTEDMVRYATMLVGYDTYPHVDVYERAGRWQTFLCG